MCLLMLRSLQHLNAHLSVSWHSAIMVTTCMLASMQPWWPKAALWQWLTACQQQWALWQTAELLGYRLNRIVCSAYHVACQILLSAVMLLITLMHSLCTACVATVLTCIESYIDCGTFVSTFGWNAAMPRQHYLQLPQLVSFDTSISKSAKTCI